MAGETRRKSLLTVIFWITLVIVACSLIAIQLGKRNEASRPRCELVSTTPFNDLERLRNVSSQDFGSLVNFAGYLVYEAKYGPPSGWRYSKNILPLELETLQVGPAESGGIELQSRADCARLKFILTYDSQMETYLAKSPWFEARQEFVEFQYLCYIEDTNSVRFARDARYSCNQTIKQACVRMRKDSYGDDYIETVALLERGTIWRLGSEAQAASTEMACSRSAARLARCKAWWGRRKANLANDPLKSRPRCAPLDGRTTLVLSPRQPGSRPTRRLAARCSCPTSYTVLIDNTRR